MDTSSETDSYDRARGHKPRGREAHRRHCRDSGRSRGSGEDDRGADISKKISTLANTLQDTSRNLSKVDQMLGHYKDHTNEQAEAMALLRENLEESINQLQSQRPHRSSGVRSASASTLHTSDLEACSGSDGQRFHPTSPLRNYTSTPVRRRRSQPASVRFKDTNQSGEDIHTMHQSLRDLRCDQQRMSDDLDREILRRNRCDIDTRQAMEGLVGHMTTSQGQASVSARVEQRLQELESEMQTEQSSAGRERRPTPRAAVSDNLQEKSGQRHVQDHEREEALTARLLKADREKSKMDQELEKARHLLEQSEDCRETLVQQVEDLRGELLRTRKEKTELQSAFQPSAQAYGNTTDREDGKGGLRGPDRLDLEKQVAELRVQLQASSVHSEVEEMRRALERKEKERLKLSIQVEEFSSDLVRQEQQRLRMLEQLKEIQSRGQAELSETDALLQESTRSRNELKTRAQEAVCKWRAKCRRLKKEVEEAQAQSQFLTDKATQAAVEKQSSQAQLKALIQQTEAARRELTDALQRLAHREEELYRKDVELSETRQRQLLLEQEIREVKEASAALEEETRRRAIFQARLEEENKRLEERVDSQVRRHQRNQDTQAELQATLKQMTSAHAQQDQRLAEEESLKKDLQKGASELQAKLTAAHDERVTLVQQLQLEREVHQKELQNMKLMMQDSRTKKDREVQDMLKLCRQERDEIQTHIKEVKADAASDKELCGVLHIKLDRMKDECDKLAALLSTKDEAHAVLHRKYQLFKQELDDKVRSGEQRHASESKLVKLEEKFLRMEAEQEAVLTSIGEELDAACRSLARNSEDRLQKPKKVVSKRSFPSGSRSVKKDPSKCIGKGCEENAISQKPGLVKDPHRWLAETKTKLRWLCEEVREAKTREQHLNKQHQQTRDQLKAFKQSRDSEQTTLLQRLDQQERLLHSLSTERRKLSEKNRGKEEEMRGIQDRMLDLEMNTRVALDHLESIPEKQCLMDDFRDLEESQRQRDKVEQRYVKYREIVWDLQRQLDESKRRIHEYKDEKLDTTSKSQRLATLSSSIKDPGTFLYSSLRSDTLSPQKRLTSSDLDDSSFNRARPLSD